MENDLTPPAADVLLFLAAASLVELSIASVRMEMC